MAERDFQTPAPEEKRLADYMAPSFSIEKLSLLFQLYEDYAIVTATAAYKMKNGVKDLWLDGGAFMELASVCIDGKRLGSTEYLLTDDGLQLKNVPAQFSLKIVTKVKPKENTRLEGLYQSGGNFCTQCEAEGFRHITYFPDRPDVMTCYDVRIEADKERCPVLLSNGNPGEVGDLDDGRHYACWVDPHPKPAYLFALVAGDLGKISDAFTTLDGRCVTLNIYVRHHDLDKCDYAMQSLINSMKWDEEKYGLVYDLDVYNIVAVSDFNMGAMENKGLNVFNTKYVLASKETATDTDFDEVERVIGHEYFHNWTGNRVTCRDWFQLSLKEGLTVFRDQEFSSDMTSRAIKRIDDVRLLRAAQFPEDSGPLSHPVRPEKYIEINNFYTATVYNKGAEVIRMMHTIIGADNFRAGMDLYFQRHDGQAVTCEDFVAAMEDASGIDLQHFSLWYSQAGTPQIDISRHYDETTGELLLKVKQHVPDTLGQSDKKPMHIPVTIAFLEAAGMIVQPQYTSKDIVRHNDGYLLHLTQAEQEFTFSGFSGMPIVSALRGFSAPVLLRHDLSLNDLIVILNEESDAYARWEAAQTLAREEIIRLQETNLASVCTDIVAGFAALTERAFSDPALTAELFELPSENAIAEFVDVIDVTAINHSRKELKKAIARRIGEERLIELYQSAVDALDTADKQQEKALRRFKNIMLDYAACLGSMAVTDLLAQQYENADNMTDSLAALRAGLYNNVQVSEGWLNKFYQKWIKEDLVIDKWFMLQAANPVDNSTQKIIELANHEAFHFENPNRMRSLIAVFASANPNNFHSISGEGYEFLADSVIRLNSINPQIAARLLAPLGRWKKYDIQRQSLMRAALQRILQLDNISPDVYELATKALKG